MKLTIVASCYLSNDGNMTIEEMKQKLEYRIQNYRQLSLIDVRLDILHSEST